MAAGLPRGRGLSRRLTGAEGRRAAGLTARTAVLLLNSGQSTHAAVATVERLNELLGTRLTLLPTWSQVTLTDADGAVAAVQAIRPVTVHMGRATLIQRRLSATGSLSLDELEDLLEEARTQPSSPTWMFALAAGLGASLLASSSGPTTRRRSHSPSPQREQAASRGARWRSGRRQSPRPLPPPSSAAWSAHSPSTSAGPARLGSWPCARGWYSYPAPRSSTVPSRSPSAAMTWAWHD